MTKSNNKFSTWSTANASSMNGNDKIPFSKFLGVNDAGEPNWSSSTIAFDDLCKAIAKKLQDDGVIPIAGD